MGQEEEFPDFDYTEILQETAAAYLFDIDGDGKRQVWIPKSQIELDEKNKNFNIPAWLAVEKQLI